MGGSSYANVTSYVRDVKYRAWGAVKSASYGNGSTHTTEYDLRLRPKQSRLGAAQKLDYTYYADGHLRQVIDLDDGQGDHPPSSLHFMSHEYTYDHVGRVLYGGGLNNYRPPFNQSYAYDVYGNMTTRSGSYGYTWPWGSDTATYKNNRRDGWSYDADGHLTLSPATSTSDTRAWQYDAAGNLSVMTDTPTSGTASTLTTVNDGDGQPVREQYTGPTPVTDYLVRSSALGGAVVTRLSATGAKEITYVPTGGLVEARQRAYPNTSGQIDRWTEWTHRDPTGTTEPGATYDPLGHYVKHIPPEPSQPTQQPPQWPTYGPSAWYSAKPNDLSTGCILDGRPADCNSVMRELHAGSAVIDSISSTGLVDLAGLGFIPSVERRHARVPDPNGEVAGDTRLKSWDALTFTPLAFPDIASIGWLPGPQDVRFSDCMVASGLSRYISNFSKEAADLINQVSGLENVSAPLLAVTWAFETDFNLHPGPNINKHPGSPERWDVGPFHINIRWTERGVAKGELSFNGLTKRDVYGSIAWSVDPSAVSPRLSDHLGTPGTFNGAPLSNGRMAARRLNAFGGSDENKASKYAPAEGRKDRKKQYNKFAPLYQKFFDCYNR